MTAEDSSNTTTPWPVVPGGATVQPPLVRGAATGGGPIVMGDWARSR